MVWQTVRKTGATELTNWGDLGRSSGCCIEFLTSIHGRSRHRKRWRRRDVRALVRFFLGRGVALLTARWKTLTSVRGVPVTDGWRDLGDL